MNNTCASAKDGNHCWHIVELLLSDPPQEKQQCCWCGTIEIKLRSGSTAHGKRVMWNAPIVIREPSKLKWQSQN